MKVIIFPPSGCLQQSKLEFGKELSQLLVPHISSPLQSTSLSQSPSPSLQGFSDVQQLLGALGPRQEEEPENTEKQHSSPMQNFRNYSKHYTSCKDYRTTLNYGCQQMLRKTIQQNNNY